MKNSLFSALFCVLGTIANAQSLSKPANDTGAKVGPLDQFSAYPARVFFSLNTGENAVRKVYLTNYTSDTIQLRLYLNDWIRDSVGAHEYFPAGKLSRSCARWVNIDKPFLELAPKQKQEVQIKMELPDSAEAVKEMKWTMLLIETTEEKKSTIKDRKKFYNKSRLGIHIYQTPPSLTTTEIKILNFKPVSGMKNTYGIICQNLGDHQFDAKTYMELSPVSENGQKITVDPTTFPIFPEQRRYIRYAIPDNVPKGKYNAVAIVDAGGDAPLEAAQALITVE